MYFSCNFSAIESSIARQINPDLIILDVMMPEMDGIETCHELRNTEGLRDVLIAFLALINGLKGAQHV